MSEYVDDFLTDRLDEGAEFDAEEVVRLIVEDYRRAMASGHDASATALGALMLQVAERFGDHPDFQLSWRP